MITKLKDHAIKGFGIGFLSGGMFGLYAAFATIDYNDMFLYMKSAFLVAFYLMAIYGICVALIGSIVSILVYLISKKTPVVTFILLYIAVVAYGSIKLWEYTAYDQWRMIGTAIRPPGFLGFLAILMVAGVAYFNYSSIKRRLKINTNGKVFTGCIVLALTVYYILHVLIVSFFLEAAEPPEIKIAKTRTKVMLIGLDSINFDCIDPLLKEGRLPNIQYLMKNGSYGKLKSIRPMASPVLWTSMVTGKNYYKQGINFFLQNVYYVPTLDKPILIPRGFGIHDIVKLFKIYKEEHTPIGKWRKVKAIWNILSEHKKTVGLVGYWCTWPAEEVNGFIVSDRFHFGGSFSSQKAEGLKLAKENTGETVPDLTYPTGLYKDIIGMRIHPSSLSPDTAKRFMNVDIDPSTYTINTDDKVSEIMMAYSQDESYARVGLELYNRYNPDFFSVYAEGPDVAGHLFWDAHEPDNPVFGGGVTEDNINKFGNTINAYYEYVDEILGRYLKVMDKDAILIVCSDHGMGANPVVDQYPPGTHRIDGSIFLMGNGVKKKNEIDNASIMDITPTILYFLGLPVAKDMDGNILTQVAEDDFLTKHPVRYIKTYEWGRGRGRGSEAAPHDDELKGKFKSLGYIQ